MFDNEENPDPSRYSRMTPQQLKTAQEFARHAFMAYGKKTSELMGIWMEHDDLTPQIAANGVAIAMAKVAAIAIKRGSITFDDDDNPYVDPLTSENILECTMKTLQEAFKDYDPVQNMIDRGDFDTRGKVPVRAVN